MWCATDTIAAIASPPGGAVRGIVRISGPTAEACWRSFVDVSDAAISVQACVVRGWLRLPYPWPSLPVQVYWWPGTRSYTRQPTAEIHAWGASPLLDAVLDAACRAGARLARPGEFTLRAFLAGRLDLTQAEAVLGVIDARGQRELDAALEQLAGGLAEPLAALRTRWLELLAHLEAGLDFVEEDIEFVAAETIAAELRSSLAQLNELEQRLERRSVAGDATRVVLYGLPNAGKSSLLNALAGESAALVADVPGTTRDYVERELAWGGRRVRVVDTAGWEEVESHRSIAGDAQRSAAQQRDRATIRVLCLEGTRPLAAVEREWLSQADDDATVIAITKADLPTALGERDELLRRGAVSISVVEGTGLDKLRRAVLERLGALEDHESSVVAGTAVRCRESVRRARESLERAAALQAAGGGEELLAVELRCALEELGYVIGAVATDDILDVIFSRFCIGK
ncbi:MAG: tRNA modification GTPase [Pirellulales bacterium]